VIRFFSNGFPARYHHQRARVCCRQQRPGGDITICCVKAYSPVDDDKLTNKEAKFNLFSFYRSPDLLLALTAVQAGQRRERSSKKMARGSSTAHFLTAPFSHASSQYTNYHRFNWGLNFKRLEQLGRSLDRDGNDILQERELLEIPCGCVRV
jgi:hypothetical protein